jgi:hypothetical protein
MPKGSVFKEKIDSIAWETFGHIGNSEAGEAFNRTLEANVTTRWAKDSSDSTLTYIGTAVPGSLTSDAVWCISVVNSVGNELYADGDTFFNNEWDERENLDYS